MEKWAAFVVSTPDMEANRKREQMCGMVSDGGRRSDGRWTQSGP